MRPLAERVTSNEELFAQANDEIAVAAHLLGRPPLVPFLCECVEGGCMEPARLSLAEYAALRVYANRYLISPTCRSPERGGALVVEQHDRFTVVDRLDD